MEDLANAKKMDGPTLKSAFKSEVDYVTDRAMDPNPPNYARPTPQAAASKGATGGQVQVTDPKGGIHTFPDQASADKFKKLANIQ